MSRLIVCSLFILGSIGLGHTPAEANVGRAVAIAKAKRKHTPEQAFRHMDTNNDGKISIAEFKARHDGEKAEHIFKRMDKDNDGFISAAEFASAMQHRREKNQKK